MELSAPTTFADMVHAAAALPPELRARVDSLFVENVLALVEGNTGATRSRMSMHSEGTANWQFPHSIHPVIERHPVTGEEYLDVSEMMTSHVVGWDDEASDELFGELGAVAYVAANTFRHDWRLHDFIVWDNISLQHRRDAFPGKGNRTLRRVMANPYELGTMYASAEAPNWERGRRAAADA